MKKISLPTKTILISFLLLINGLFAYSFERDIDNWNEIDSVQNASSATATDGGIFLNFENSDLNGSLTYYWSTQEGSLTDYTSQNQTNLKIGKYFVTVTDSENNKVYGAFEIDSSGCEAHVSYDITKAGGFTGRYNVGVEVLDPNYNNWQYKWSNGSTENTLQYITTGVYQVEITPEDNSCGTMTREISVYNNSPCNGEIVIDSVSAPTDNTSEDGFLRVRFAGFDYKDATNTVYIYKDGVSFNSPSFADTLDFESLDEGLYSISFQPSGCKYQVDTLLKAKSGVSCIGDINYKITPPSNNNTKDGTIEILGLSNNRTIYSYLIINNYNSQDSIKSPKADSLESGEYMISVIDDSNCTYEKNYINISQCYNETSSFYPSSESGNASKWFFSTEYASSSDSYKWYFGDGQSSTELNPIHTYSKSGFYTTSLELTDTITGCVSSVHNDYPITVRIPGDTTPICKAIYNYYPDTQYEDRVFFITSSLTSSSSSENLVHYWDFGNGLTDNGSNLTRSDLPQGQYNLTLRILDTVTGCKDNISQLIDVIYTPQPCTAKFSYSITGENTAQFKDLSTNNSDTAKYYYWDFGDYTTSDSANPIHTYEYPGYYDAYLTAWGDGDCYSSTYQKIYVPGGDNNLIADFYTESIEDSIIIFTNWSAGNYINAYWTFGDGAYAKTTDEQVTHNYAAQGFYNVCLNVYNDTTGASNVKCKTVTVGSPACNLKTSFTYRKGLNSDSIAFTNTSMNKIFDTEWYWYFGDGEVSTDENPVHLYDYAGEYNVGVVAYTPNTSCSDYYETTVRTTGGFECKADFDYMVDANTNTLSLTNKSKGKDLFYYWSFDDEEMSYAKDLTKKFKNSGKHYVSLTIFSANGNCMDYKEMEIQVGESPCNADFTYMVKSDGSVQLYNKTIGADLTYYWYFSDGGVTNEPNPEYNFAQNGYYTIALAVYNWTTGCYDYKEKGITINSMNNDVQADFSFMVSGITGKVWFASQAMGKELNYIWNFGDRSTPNYSNQSLLEHAYASNGFYNVCLTVENETKMSHTKCKMVNVNGIVANKCMADFNVMIDSATKKVKFMDRSVPRINNCSWNFGDNNTATDSTYTHTYTIDGYYVASLTINTAGGCKSTAYKAIPVGTVSKKRYVDFRFDESDDYLLKATGYPVDFVAISHGDAAKLKWDFNSDGIIDDSTSQTPTFVYPNEKDSTFTACLYIEDPITGDKEQKCEQVIVKGSNGIDQISSSKSFAKVFPNPLKDNATVSFNLNKQGEVSIELLSIQGIVLKKWKKQGVVGENNLEINSENITAGNYFIKIVTNEFVSQLKVQVIQ